MNDAFHTNDYNLYFKVCLRNLVAEIPKSVKSCYVIYLINFELKLFQFKLGQLTWELW